MVINKFKWTKKARITVAVLCIVLATASLMALSLMNQVAEAAILEPMESPPETIFYDDFSGDLSSWNIVSGTWAIENGELSGETSAFGERIMIEGLSVSDFTAEYKIRFISTTVYEIGLVFRGAQGTEPDNCYWVGIKRSGLFLHERKAGRSYTLGTYSFAPSLNVDYTIKVWTSGQSIKVWLNGNLRIEVSSTDFTSGSIGIMAWSGGSEHAHIDYVNVSEAATLVPTAYSLAVRAGATQIVTTCSWSGSGNLTIANLTSPTTTYYESDMGIYEKTTLSGSNIFNIKRALLSIDATTSPETWVLRLSLSSVTAYQVSVEIS